MSLSTILMLVATTLPAANYPEQDAPDTGRKPGPIATKYKDAADQIFGAAHKRNAAWHKMQELCDGIGHRLSGSYRLEQAVEWAAQAMRDDGHENVRLEPVEVPHWVRGRESLVMQAPQRYEMPMLGLGGSVGTNAMGIIAHTISVPNKEAFDALSSEDVSGKIVLFNYPMKPYHPQRGSDYGAAVRYRVHGARWAAEKGAVACLIRSVTPNSLRTPHTGGMRYGEAKKKIPAAAITIEDAEMITRLTERGVPVTLQLKMEATDKGTTTSHNVIGELRGSEKTEEVVVIGGHLDSWDVGHGAHDDAAGCVIAMEAISVLRRLNLIPKRTIRVVLWTNEENGLAGGRQYAKAHEPEMGLHVAAIESDSGAFAPRGYSVDCKDKHRLDHAAAQMNDILALFNHLEDIQVETGGSGADISPMKEHGVLLMGHLVDGSSYFDLHHSPADTLDKVDPEDLTNNVAVMATVAYILADMDKRIGDE